MAVVRETVHLYHHLLHQGVLGLHSPYGLQNFDDPENSCQFLFQLLNPLVIYARFELSCLGIVSCVYSHTSISVPVSIK